MRLVDDDGWSESPQLENIFGKCTNSFPMAERISKEKKSMQCSANPKEKNSKRVVEQQDQKPANTILLPDPEMIGDHQLQAFFVIKIVVSFFLDVLAFVDRYTLEMDYS